MAFLLAALTAMPASAAAKHRLRWTTHGDPQKKGPRTKPRVRARSAALGPFASTWPCTEQTSNLADVTNAPQVKVIYAYPTDNGGSHLRDVTYHYADLFQADANYIQAEVAATPGSQKSIRFDVGAAGPPGGACDTNPEQYLDIQSVALPQTSSYYNADDNTFDRVTSDVDAVLKPEAPTGGRRVTYVIYTDNITPPGGYAGQGMAPRDERPTLLNDANQGSTGNGRLFAVVYGRGGSNFIAGFGDRERSVLHELSHTLGAVQDSAPHASRAAHCYTTPDIMCYNDAGPYFSSGGSLQNCQSSPVGYPYLYDCEEDDYFSPAPAGGSWLASHWNLYDSAYLCPVDTCNMFRTPPSSASISVIHPNGQLALQAATDGTIVDYEWDLDGDGYYDLDTGANPVATPAFRSETPRTISVRASEDDGTFVLGQTTFAPVKPSPAFTVNGTVAIGQTLQLDGSPTVDPDGVITQYLWDLDGDGSYETNTGLTKSASKTITDFGQFSLGLEVDYSWGYSFARQGPYNLPPPLSTGVTTPVLKPTTALFASPTLAARKVGLSRLVAGGLPLALKCAAPCNVRFALTIGKKTAKALHLKGKAPVVIARLSGQFAAGNATPNVRLTASAKKALKHAKSLTATLSGAVKQNSTPSLPVTKTITFKR